MSVDDPGGEVVILGAGFSYAASSAMPLVKDLGKEVLERLRADHNRSDRLTVLLDQLGRILSDDGIAPASPGFEGWLARLAEDQPYVSQRENLERRALFSLVSEVMWQVMVERQDQVLTPLEGKSANAPPHEWLFDIVSLFHQRRSTVVTLNYDNLVEHAATAANHLWGEPTTPWRRGRAVRVDDLFDGVPPFLPPVEQEPEAHLAEGGPAIPRPAVTVPTFSLLKLHGSLSWFWIPTDPSGMTLASWNVADLGRGLRNEQARRQVLPGREPFLVPPTTSKASYFETLVTRELWRRAYDALKVASRVVFVGYSLPAADSTFLGLLEDTIADRDIEVVVVDTRPEPVKAQLQRLGVRNEPAQHQDIKTWVAEEIAQSSRQLAERLRRMAADSTDRFGQATLVVGWLAPNSPTREVFGVEDRGNDGLVLKTNPHSAATYGVPLKFSELKQYLGHAERVLAEFENHRVPLTKIIDPGPMGPGLGIRLDLFPVGRPNHKAAT